MDLVKVFGAHLVVEYGTVGEPPPEFQLKHDRVDIAGGRLKVWSPRISKELVIHYLTDQGREELAVSHNRIRFSGEINSPLVERAAGPLIAHTNWDDVASFHAAAVIKDGQALLVLGPSGTGKTSTAYALTDFGYVFAADDVSVVRSSTLEFLAGPRRAWLRRSGNKIPLEFNGECPDACVTTAVWMTRGDAFGFQRLSTGIAASRLLGSMWRLSDAPEMTEEWVKNATEVARRVPVYEFTFPPDPSGGPKHVSQLLESLNALGC